MKCANCNNEFIIDEQDKAFYNRIKVPEPVWCPDCKRQRRMSFRNERALYKRKCDATGEEVISMFSPDKKYKVYEQKYWWSDKWNPLDYGRDYDWNKPFMKQYNELLKDIPWPSLSNWNNVKSDYCNFTSDNKSCYLVFGGDFNENCAYCQFSFYSKDSLDLYWLNKSELCYECIDGEECYKVLFSQYTRNCTESAFLFNCSGCSHCFACVNLRNQSYCIFNKQYTKQDYEKEIAKYDLGSFSSLQSLKNKFYEFKLKNPHRYADIIKGVNSTGNNIHNTKNCKNCFDTYDGAEDSKDILIAGWNIKDVFNSNHIGYNTELVYDSQTSFLNSQKIFFSYNSHKSHDINYCINSSTCSNLFGCMGLRNNSYCILNKQYTKEQYNELVPKIIKHMMDMPYTDKKGRTYKYGEFFPAELSPFCYNETIAQEYFPLTKEQALEQEYTWKDAEHKDVQPDITELPDHIKDIKDDIIGKIIQCEHKGECNEQCTKAFKIIPRELNFYRKMNIPIPRLCHNCRHYQRIKYRNPLKLWKRTCMCNKDNHFHKGECTNEFETSYAPDSKEIVYCEECYKREVS